MQGFFKNGDAIRKVMCMLANNLFTEQYVLLLLLHLPTFLSQSAQADTTKYHRLVGLNNRHLFFCTFGSQTFKIEVPLEQVSAETSHLTCRQLPSHGFLTWPFSSLCSWRKISCLSSSPCKDSSPIRLGPCSYDLI